MSGNRSASKKSSGVTDSSNPTGGNLRTPPESPPGGPRRSQTPSLKIETNSAMHGSQTKKGPGATAASAQPSTRSAVHIDGIDELLSTNQKTLAALGQTFSVLGTQTILVATLGPALAAVSKLEELRAAVETHRDKKDEALRRLEAELEKAVDARVQERLRGEVDRIVAEEIERGLEARVQKALQEQITQQFKERLKTYNERILTVKIALANAEARRRNAQIRREAFGEPLRPLLRPLPASGTETKTEDGKTAKNAKKAKSQVKNAAPTESGGQMAGTPSEVFPRSVTAMLQLSARDAKQLRIEYGIPSGEGGEADGDDDWEDLGEDSDPAKRSGSAGGQKPQGTSNGTNAGANAKEKKAKEKEEEDRKAREQKLVAREAARTADLNEFMKFIGVSSSWSCPVVVLRRSAMVPYGARHKLVVVVSAHVDGSALSSFFEESNVTLTISFPLPLSLSPSLGLPTPSLPRSSNASDPSPAFGTCVRHRLGLRMSMGTAVLLAWYAVCASMGDGADAGVRMDFS
ncbi:hypothetical protein BD414DRAFT_539935 [Trametes punicea]|nr:hypothetical protein BD414DRAFT_539935 [Trametes punicea]